MAAGSTKTACQIATALTILSLLVCQKLLGHGSTPCYTSSTYNVFSPNLCIKYNIICYFRHQRLLQFKSLTALSIKKF